MNFTFSKFRGRRFGRAALLCGVLVFFASPTRAAEPAGPEEGLRAALGAYDPADPTASRAAADAFFAFESSALDRDLALRDPSLYRDVEDEWARLIAEMRAGAPGDAIDARGRRLLDLLERGHRSTAAGGSAFFDALLIILREGFEAILIVSALAAYLTRVGQHSRKPYLYGGAALAVVASVGLWAAARTILSISGVGREALEGATMLVATVVLFWVSYWLISKAEADRWQAFVRSRAEQALGRGALLGFGLLSFVVVFREGFETVLFYEALAARVGGAAGQSLLVGGFVTGCTLLAILYVSFLRLGPRIPLRSFFGVTGGLLYLMAFKFAGAGVRELQEAQLLSQTPVDFFRDSAFLCDWLGVYPYLEPLALQALLLILAIFAAVSLWYGGGRSEARPVESVQTSRIAAAGR